MRTRQSGVAEGAGPPPAAAPAVQCGRVVTLSSSAGSTIVSVALAGGSRRDLVVGACPDPPLARALTAGFRRLGWVRLDLSGAVPRCQISGIARRPRTQQLPLAAALALVDAGIPSVVRLRGPAAR